MASLTETIQHNHKLVSFSINGGVVKRLRMAFWSQKVEKSWTTQSMADHPACNPLMHCKM